MIDPQPGEPLVVRGISIPWDSEANGWFFDVGRERVGIERFSGSWPQNYVSYRYIRLAGGPWSSSGELEFSINAMIRELTSLSSSEKFMQLLLALATKEPQ